MPAFGPIKRKDLIYYLRQAGFSGPFPGGKHQYVIKGNISVRIPNPHQRDIGPSLLSRILRQAEISRDEWERL